MSAGHDVKKEGIELPASEANFAALCVAVTTGSVGGNIGTLLIDVISYWFVLLIVIVLGFVIPWVVCKYLFKTAHAWYGANTLSHRIYDAVGIVSAFVAFYI